MNPLVEIEAIVHDVHLLKDSTILNTIRSNAPGAFSSDWAVPGHPRIVPGDLVTITITRSGETR